MFTTLGTSVCLLYWYKSTNTDAEGVALDQYQREAQYRIYKGKEQPVKVFTCTVGGQPSFAAYCLYSLDDVVSSSVCVSFFFPVYVRVLCGVCVCVLVEMMTSGVHLQGSLLRGMSLKIKRKMKSAATMLELAGMG